jgi:hypothetical protein
MNITIYLTFMLFRIAKFDGSNINYKVPTKKTPQLEPFKTAKRMPS